MPTEGYAQLKDFLLSLAPIPETELAKALALFRPLHLGKDEFLLRAGETPKTLGFVLSGILRLYSSDAAGNEWTKSFCTEQHALGAYSAFLLKKPSRLFIQALEASSLLVVSSAAYEQLFSEHSCWQVVTHKLVQALFLKKEFREAELLLDDATTRYQQFHLDYPGLEDRIKQRHIASYLGITPVSLSRIRSQMKSS